MPIDWPRFVDLIGRHERYLLTSHVRPDCDALGSELGLAAILESLGKQVRIVNAQATPPNLAFIDPMQRIRTLGLDAQADVLDDIEVLIVLDTSAWVQLGAMAEVIRGSRARRMVIDHHVSQDDLGAELFKDTQAEATGRLVADAARHLGVRLTPAMATPLFAALATDTGWFRFSSTTSNTYRVAAELVEAGADPTAIYNALYEQLTLARLRLMGRTLSNTRAEQDGRLVYTVIRRADFEATGALPSDTEDLVNMTLQVGGSEVAVILVEQPRGGCKISFRSRSAVDCSRLAEQFGGGGHKAAAGATINEPFETALTRVLDAVRAALR